MMRQEETSSQGLGRSSPSIETKLVSHRLQPSGPSLNSIPSRRVVDFSEQVQDCQITQSAHWKMASQLYVDIDVESN